MDELSPQEVDAIVAVRGVLHGQQDALIKNDRTLHGTGTVFEFLGDLTEQLEREFPLSEAAPAAASA